MFEDRQIVLESGIPNSRFYVVCLHSEVKDQGKNRGGNSSLLRHTAHTRSCVSPVQQNPCILGPESRKKLKCSEVTHPKHRGLAGTPRGQDGHTVIGPLKLPLGRPKKREPCAKTLTGKKPASLNPKLEKKLLLFELQCWKLVI